MMALKLAAVVFLAAFEIGFMDSVQPDYIFINSARGYYKIHKVDATWYEARDKCKSEGSLLYHPNTEEEFKIVLSALAVEDKNDFSSWIHTGLSDLHKLKEYRTLDGRSISQVQHKWYPGRPDSITDIKDRCGAIYITSHQLDMAPCDSYKRRFICKNSHSIENVMTTAAEEMKTIIANSSDKQTMILERLAEAAVKQAAALERLTANQDTTMERITEVGANLTAAIERLAVNQAEAIDRLTVNQAATLEQIAEASAKLQTLTDTMKSQIANQTAALERIAVAGTNEAAAIERIAETGANEAAAIERMSQNQTAIMERQALAVEKLVSLQEESDQIDARTQQ